MTRRTLFLAVLAVLLLAVPAYVEGRGLECAERISSQRRDAPASGHLIGTATVTETKTISAGGHLGNKNVGGSTTTIIRTESTTYQVGTYEMEDGQRLQVDCRNYMIRR